MRKLSEIGNKEYSARLYEMHIHPGRMTANGEAGSFEGANNFRDAVSRLPYFEDIMLTDVKDQAHGGVSFSIAIAVKDEFP